MLINPPCLNFILAAIYAIIYNYIYCNYMYGVWATYVDGTYTSMNAFNYVLYVLFAAFPFVFYKGLKHIASAFSLFVYVFVYIPFIESLFVNDYSDWVRLSYSVLFFFIVCALFLTDPIYIFREPFKRERKLISFKVVIFFTFLFLLIELLLNSSQLHLVNFFAEDNDLYSLRSETSLKGIYIVCWIRSALLPLLLVYYLNKRSYLGVAVVVMAYLSVFMLDKQKLTIIFPLALIVIYYTYLYYKEAFSKYFHVFLMGLFAIMGLLFTNLETNPIILALGMIIVLRIQCIAGVELERYFDFFINNDNPYTYYTHIGFIDKLTGLYPYGELSIGQAVAGDGSNSNAAFWLMDGVAAGGMIGCVIISIFFIFFKSIMNSLDVKCSVGICVTVLLFGIQSMVNMSLFTAIISNGFLVLFFLFMFVDVSAIEGRKMEKCIVTESAIEEHKKENGVATDSKIKSVLYMINRFVFLVPALSQPRCIKRITSIKEMGYECNVFGYKRGKYDVNEYPNGINVEVLDTVGDGDYFRKAIKSWKNLSKVVSSNKGEDVAFYAFGFFQAFVCAIKGVKYVYEISDIFYAYPRLRRIKGLLRSIDKWLIKKSALTVMTSGGFLEFFGIVEDKKILIVPNKVSAKLAAIPRNTLDGDLALLRFGYVGSIKYDSIFRFADTIGKYYPNYHFDFYGSAVDDIKPKLDNVVSKYDNVTSHGIYKNPEDLESIYSGIDIVIACYDVNSENERIAEPNKLYESLYFCKPIIVSDGIYLARRVKELDCGFSIDASTVDSIREFIDGLKGAELKRISEKEYQMPVEDIMNMPESLQEAIKQFVDNNRQ